MKLKIETVELKHKNIYGKEIVERKVYYLVRTSLFGLIKRYLYFGFGGILPYWTHSTISTFLEDRNNLPGITLCPVTLKKHKFGVAYFKNLDDAKAVLEKIKNNPNKYAVDKYIIW